MRLIRASHRDWLEFRLANKLYLHALVGLIVSAAIPYGTVEPWWKAAFVCAVFAICILALIETLVHKVER